MRTDGAVDGAVAILTPGGGGGGGGAPATRALTGASRFEQHSHISKLDMLISLERSRRDLDTIYEGAIRGAEVAQPHSAVREYNFAVRTGDRGIIDGEVVTFAAAKFVDTLPEQKRSRPGACAG
jgi:hypothetical protein